MAITDAYLEIKNDSELENISDRLHFVESTSYFEGLDLCAGEESGFNNYSAPVEYSMHPNNVGQHAYYLAIEDQLD